MSRMADRGGHSVILAGIGGRGVLVAGRLLAEAAMARYEHISWLPSMTTAMRGGPCEATVVLSHRPVASPLVWQPQALVVMEASQLAPLASRVQPGGLIITESAGLGDKPQRQDVHWLELPALATAVALGDSLAANLILLGAYVQLSQVLEPELLETYLEKRFGGKEKMVSLNRRAFREGMRLARERRT